MNPKPLPAKPLLCCLIAALSACGGDDAASPAAGGPGNPIEVPTTPPGPAPAPLPATATPTAVGEASGIPVSTTIGPAGGSLASPDGSLHVSVPSGAFATPTELRLQPISNQAPGGLGKAWRISPHGVEASQPITLTWRVAAEEARAVAGLTVARQRADGTWTALRAAVHDSTAGTVSVQTRRFSDWSLVAGLQLRPATAWVEAGNRLALSITNCRTVDVSADAAEIPLAACEIFGSASFNAFQWAANGVAGGDATQGRVQDPGEFLYPGVAAYVAPARLPTANPVAVSARYTAAPFGTGVTLVSNVRVVEASSGCDWLQHVEAFTAEVEARHLWSGADGPWSVRIDHQATVSGRLVRVASQAPILRWSGALGTGQVRVDDARTLGSGSAALVETDRGAGSPFLGDAPQAAPASVATLSVDLVSCKVWVGAEFHVDTQRTTAGLPSSTPTQGGAAIAIGPRDIGPFRIVSGTAAVPAVGLGDFVDRYAVQGLNNAMQVEQAGSADVRWLFKPAP